MSKHSAACCSISPVVAEGYEAKGKYITLNGTKTYVTGPSHATTALFLIFDIFGYFPQTLQGADILAHSDKEHQYQVFMPDFFNGEPLSIKDFPPDTDEKKGRLGKFFKEKASPPEAVEKVPGLVKAAEEYNSAITTWGVMGYCWGAKIAVLLSGKDTLFKAAVQVHPGMIDAADAAKCTIPICMLASKDEPADDVKKFEEALTVTKHVETFDTQIHGWMAARANLEDKKVLAEYERGYKITLTFFHDNL